MAIRCPTLSEIPLPPPGKTGWPWTEQSPPGESSAASGIDNQVRSWPRITIVTPSYNQGEFLEETIRSVLLQGYPNLEYVIVDGGSTDDSVEIIHKYEKYLAWWTSESDRGHSHALNKGFARTSGDIHAFLNSDDVYEPGALNACVNAFKKGSQWVVGHVHYFQHGIGFWPVAQASGKSLADWLVPCPISQPGCFWAAQLHREMGQFREDLRYFFDYEFWLRMRFNKHIRPTMIPQNIAIYRLHPRSKTMAHNSAFIHEGKIIQEWYKGRLTFSQQLWLPFSLQRRKARIRGAKAVSLLKRRQFSDAIRALISAFAAWPLLFLDQRIFSAIYDLVTGSSTKHPVPKIWPDWDD